MQDPFLRDAGPEFAIHPKMRLTGTVAGLFVAQGDDFQTRAVDELPLTFEGIPGDVHSGHTRRSGGREPWYKRGTEMRNERQLSLLSHDELVKIAHKLDAPQVKAEWIGGNMIVEGIENFTMLPPRTLLFFEGGVTLKIDGDNAPCRVAGRAIADQFEGRQDIELNFARESQHLRGLVGWVEKPGIIRAGEMFTAHVPPQWIYSA